MTPTLPKVMSVDRTGRTRLRFFALGAVYRSSGYTETLTDAHRWSVEGATHVVRAESAGDAVHAFLSGADAAKIENWLDDERDQRLLFVCPIEELPFLSSWLMAGRKDEFTIQTSTTHRRANQAPIRFLRIR